MPAGSGCPGGHAGPPALGLCTRRGRQVVLGNRQRTWHLPRGALSRLGVCYLAGCDSFNRIPRAPAALGVGLYNFIECPREVHFELQSPPGEVVALPSARLRHRDTFRFAVPYATLWHGHRGPHHPFLDKDDPWPAAVRECLNQCGDKQLHYCRRKQGPSDRPGWRGALVNLFHTSSTPDPRLRLSPRHEDQTGHQRWPAGDPGRPTPAHTGPPM